MVMWWMFTHARGCKQTWGKVIYLDHRWRYSRSMSSIVTRRSRLDTAHRTTLLNLCPPHWSVETDQRTHNVAVRHTDRYIHWWQWQSDANMLNEMLIVFPNFVCIKLATIATLLKHIIVFFNDISSMSFSSTTGEINIILICDRHIVASLHNAQQHKDDLAKNCGKRKTRTAVEILEWCQAGAKRECFWESALQHYGPIGPTRVCKM